MTPPRDRSRAARRGGPTTPRDAALAVVRALRADGRCVLFAGGCVRDELLGREPSDYDVATDATPDDVDRLFPRSRGVGRSFGVVLVRTRGHTIEVATFRSDASYSDRRRPDAVRFSTPREDALRRDFTANALFLDPLAGPADPPPPDPDGADAPATRPGPLGGLALDYVGGLIDLDQRVLRAVGDPGERLAEDHLRALRAARFAARLGFAVDPDTAAAVRDHAAQLAGVSRERVGDELRKLLAHPARARGVALLHALGLAGEVLGPLLSRDAAHAFGDEPDRRPRVLASLPDDARPMTALAAWLLDVELAGVRSGDASPVSLASVAERARDAARRLRDRLCLTNDETADLAELLELAAAFAGSWRDAGVAGKKRLAARRLRAPALHLLRGVDPDAADRAQREIQRLARDPGGLAPDPIVTGDHLIEAGFAPSREFGGWLRALYDRQLEGRLPDRATALRLVREWTLDPDRKPNATPPESGPGGSKPA